MGKWASPFWALYAYVVLIYILSSSGLYMNQYVLDQEMFAWSRIERFLQNLEIETNLIRKNEYEMIYQNVEGL